MKPSSMSMLVLGEVHHGVGFERPQGLADEGRVGEVADEQVHGVGGDLLPTADTPLQAGDGHQGVHAHFEVVAPAGEIVHDPYTMALSGKVERSGPTQVAVTTEYQNVHLFVSSSSCMTRSVPRRSLRTRMWTALLLPSVTLD
jgi:hypothetical protein